MRGFYTGLGFFRQCYCVRVLLQMRLCTGPSFWQCYCVADAYALTVGGDVLLTCFGNCAGLGCHTVCDVQCRPGQQLATLRPRTGNHTGYATPHWPAEQRCDWHRWMPCLHGWYSLFTWVGFALAWLLSQSAAVLWASLQRLDTGILPICEQGCYSGAHTECMMQ
jgi:hypothetical protein